MFYSTRIIVDGIKKVNMWLSSTIIAKARDFGLKAWMDQDSITPTGEVDIYFTGSDDSDIDDFCCWLRNTYEIESAAATA